MAEAIYTVWNIVCENNYSHIVNNFWLELNTFVHSVCPPDEFGKLALGASQAIFEGLGGCNGVKGWCPHFVQNKCGRSAPG